LPFIGDTLPEICTKILQAEPPRVTDTIPDAPDDLQRIISRALTKKPDGRYQNLAEFAIDLAPLGGEDACRSADVICRVLGVAAPPRQPMPSSPDLQPAALGTGAVVGAGSVPGHAGTGVGTNPGMGAPAVGVGSVPGAPPPMGPGAAAQPGVVSVDAAAYQQTHPSVDQPMGAPVIPAGAVQTGAAVAGRSTAAPVYQTMDGMAPSKSHGGLIAAVAIGCLVLGGGIAAVAVMAAGGDESSETAAAATAAPSDEPATTADSASTEPEPSPVASASAETADAGAPETAATASAATAAPTRTRQPVRRPGVRRPAVLRPGGQRPGDEAFE
jgi:serine/threonine-protein kinase